MSIEEKLQRLGLNLPEAPRPVGSYQPVIRAGSIAYLSGQIAKKADGSLIKGKVGLDLSVDEAQEAARVAVLNVMSVIKHHIGFDRLDRVLRVVGYVQSAPDFYDQAQVMNAASDLLADVFGEQGIHARSAVGVASLPLNSAVEIEVTLQIK